MKTIKELKLAFATLAALAPLSGCAVLTNNPNATIHVRVVDDEGKPITGAHAHVYNIFDTGTKPGLTDTNGMHSIHLYNIFEISGSFKKLGYYTSYGVFWEASEWSKVPPANTNFTVVLKRIIDPVPMTYKNIRTHIPRNDEPVGFDLAIGDWVVPSGKGTQADIYFTGTLRFESRQDFDVKVSVDFVDPFCGIQDFYNPKSMDKNKIGSELIPPYTAPDFEYRKMLSLWSISSPKPKRLQQHLKADRNYIFRTRVITNEKDEIIKANYGWVVGDFIIDPSQNNKIFLSFRYYYNPDPKSRSLEPKEIADRQAK